MSRDELIQAIRTEGAYAEIGDWCASAKLQLDGVYVLRAYWRGILKPGDYDEITHLTDITRFIDIDQLLSAMNSEIPLSYWGEMDN